jgi:peptide/nickel transport system permease protein
MRYLLRRFVSLVPVLFAVTFLYYLLLDLLPTDPAIAILGPIAPEEAVAELRDELGLDAPLPVRYVRWVGDVATGDLGRSYLNGQPVAEGLAQRLPVTLELLVASQVLALAVAVPLGVAGGHRPDGWLDRISGGTAFGLLAVPNFVFAVLLVYVFALQLGWFPATGLPKFGEDPAGHIRSLVLPVVSLATAELAVYMRLVRTELITTLQEDYILSARAKGLPGWRVLLRHALRPSSFSLLTVVGLNLGRLVGGTVVVETIFALPGMGNYAVQAIFSRDYVVVQGFVVVVAVGYVLVNLVVDLLYAVLDPRIRHERATT